MTVRPAGVTIRRATWPGERDVLRSLRHRVFVEEQGVPESVEWDGRDAEAIHVLAERNGSFLGCGRLLPNGRVGRLAVAAECRGMGIGASMLEELARLARTLGVASVHLHAQLHAAVFYELAGFRPLGEPFREAGIEHITMQRTLDYSGYAEPLGRAEWPAPSDTLLLNLAQAARRELAVLSPELGAGLASPAFAGAVMDLCRRARRSRVRVLVQDARSLAQRGHPLLELARRAPSRISLLELSEHPQWSGDTLLIADRSGLLHRLAEAPSSRYAPGDRAAATRELVRYEQLWNAGTPDPNLRALAI